MNGLCKLAIFCPYPPPYTGVTLHAMRLHEFLVQEGVPHTLYASHGLARPEPGIVRGQKSPVWFIKTFLTCPESVVHVHAYRPMPVALAGLILSARRRKTLCHIHSEGMVKLYAADGPLSRWVVRAGFRKCHTVFVVNEGLGRFAVDVLGVPGDRVCVVPAFIPPSEEGMAKVGLPLEVAEFIQAHSPLLCVTGSFGVMHEGRDSYGFELLPDLLGRLRTRWPQAGLAVAVNYVDDPEHQQRYVEKIRDCGLADSVLVLENLGLDYLELVRRSDMFLRPSYTDGDALSVREALHLGVPVVASNCAPRPKGCVLFRTGDAEDLAVKVAGVIEDEASAAGKLAEYAPYHAGRILVDFYRKLIAP